MALNVIFDADGVLYKFEKFHDIIPPAELSTEEQEKYVLDKIYERLKTKGYYLNLKTQSKMVQLSLALIMRGVNTQIISCSINESTDKDKETAFKRDLPWIRNYKIIRDGLGNRKSDYVECNPEDINILIDDYPANCIAFEKANPNRNAAIRCLNKKHTKDTLWYGKTLYSFDTAEKNIEIIQKVALEMLEKN